MRTNFFIFALIVSFAAFASAADAPFRVSVKFGEIPNLTYQLDCLADAGINCSRENLGELWRREFLIADEDRRMLKEWARLRELYSKEVEFSEDAGANSSSINLFDKIRIAGFQAASVEDYAARLDLLTAPADRTAFERVVRHFEPRFRVWWLTEAAKSGDEFARQTDALIRSAKISEPLKQFYNFYAPVLPAEYEISFNLFYIPGAIKESTNGQQLQNYSVAEFKPQEKPEQRIDVAVHELCHFFYENMKPENRRELERKFYGANRAGAIPAYNLLNEALAAAFGNGIIARAVTPRAEYDRYLAAKNSFYNNASIDRAAKAILPLLDERLKNRKTINDAAFADEYTGALEKAFGEDLLAPKLYLSEMFLFMDAEYAVSIRRDARRILETASFYAAEGDLADENILDEYRKQPRLNSVFIVYPDNIDRLPENKIITEAQAEQIQNEYESKGRVLFAAERAKFTYVYIIAARDADGAKELVEKLANAKQFQGIYKL